MTLYNPEITLYEECSDCCNQIPSYGECVLFPDGIATRWETVISLLPTKFLPCTGCNDFSNIYRFSFEQDPFRSACRFPPVPVLSGPLRCHAPIYYPYNNFDARNTGDLCFTDDYVYLFVRLIFNVPCHFSLLIRWRMPLVDFDPFGTNVLELEYINSTTDCTIPSTLTLEPII